MGYSCLPKDGSLRWASKPVSTTYSTAYEGSTTPSRDNGAVRRADSGLVRLNYVESDLYGQDPALGQPPVPLLLPIDDLRLSEPGSDADHEHVTLLVRRRNRILHELSQVERALRDGLALLGGGPVASPRGSVKSMEE
jgi:hypothetical protein